MGRSFSEGLLVLLFFLSKGKIMKKVKLKNIKSYAKFLKIFSIIILLPIIFVKPIITWFVNIEPLFYKYSEFWSGIRGIGAAVSYSYESTMQAMPLTSKFCGFGIDVISVLIILWGFWFFIKVLNCFQSGEIFSQQIFYFFKNMSKAALVWTIYQPISFMLKSLALTLHNPPGQRMIVAQLSSPDIVNIFIVGFFFVITSLMYEGYKLKKDQDLTV